MPIPRVAPFEVPSLGVRFTDAREARNPGDWLQARDIMDDTLMRWARRTGTRTWCEDDERYQERRRRALDAWLQANPNGTVDEFLASREAVLDEVSQDPDLDVLRLVARMPRRATVRGGFIMQNIRREREAPGIIGIRLFPMMGVRTPEPMPEPRKWGLAAEWFLANDIPLVNGGALRVVEVDLPETEDTSYGLEHGDEMSELWDRMGGVADAEADGERAPTRLRAMRERRQGDVAKPVRVRPRSEAVTETRPEGGGRPRRA